MRLPVLLVLHRAPPAELSAALDRAGWLSRAAELNEAAQSVNDGWAQLVVCERVPGWQALAARVITANGSVVLLGPAPEPHELRWLSASDVHCAESIAAVPEAVERAWDRIVRRDMVDHLPDALRDRAESAERISRYAQSIALQLDLGRVVQEAIARTRDLCDADGASLLLVDPKTGELTFDVVDGGAGDSIQRVRLKVGEGIAGHVARTAEPMLVPAVRQSAFFDPRCDTESGFVTGSVIAAPLVVAGDLIGVLEAVRGADRAPFQSAHLRRLIDLAPHVGIAVGNAQMTARLRDAQEQVLRDNVELERRIQERTDQIARAKKEWEATFDSISEPIAVQEGFTIRRSNLAYARQAGVSITQVPGRKCYELLAGRNAPCPGCPLAVEGGGLEGEISLDDQRAFRFSGFRMSSVTTASEDTVVAHYRDVTNQRSLERRLRETERLASLGQLASGAAHEINNPLGFLISNLKNLREQLEELEEVAGAIEHGSGAARGASALVKATGELVTDGREMIDESLQGAQRVAEIVRALRELSRLQVSREVVADVGSAVSRVIRSEFQNPALVRVDVEPGTRAQIDPLQLDQALTHVLRNARQASASQPVFVRVHARDAHAVIEIEDTGCGIRPDDLNRIYEPFFTTRGVGKGMGLGLTATWGIVQRHGGEIDVRSEVGRGTCVTLTLPRVIATEACAAAA